MNLKSGVLLAVPHDSPRVHIVLQTDDGRITCQGDEFRSHRHPRIGEQFFLWNFSCHGTRGADQNRDIMRFQISQMIIC